MPYAGMSDQRNSRGLRELAFALLLQRATLRMHEEEAFTLVWGATTQMFSFRARLRYHLLCEPFPVLVSYLRGIHPFLLCGRSRSIVAVNHFIPFFCFIFVILLDCKYLVHTSSYPFLHFMVPCKYF